MSKPEKSNIWRERGNQPEKYMRDPLEERAKEAIQQAYQETEGRLGSPDYQSWREQQDGRLPTIGQIVGEFGTWSKACEYADVPPKTRGWSRYDRIIAFKEANEDIEGDVTTNKYREWAGDQQDQKPSAAAIRALTGEWQLIRLIYGQ